MLGLLVHFQYEDGSIVVKIPKERWFNKLTVDSILTFMQRDVDLATFLFLLLEWCRIYILYAAQFTFTPEARCNQVLPICSKNSGQRSNV